MNNIPWGPIVFGLLLMTIAWLVHAKNAAEKDLANAEAEKIQADSMHYHNSVEILKQNALLHEQNDSLHNFQALLRKDVLNWIEHAGNAWDKEKKGLLRQLVQVNTARATAPELDSIQFSLYGAPPDDSLHTIPLDYSRKLTGDALRLPIEQRLATRAGDRLDSAESHYGRLRDSYELDIRTYKEDAAADHEAITGLMKNVGEMQGTITKQNKQLDNPWSFGLHGGYGATLSGGQIYMGPQVGASVQYKIRLRKRR